MHHEEGRLNGRHDAIHQHPVELQDGALLPPQVLLKEAASWVIDRRVDWQHAGLKGSKLGGERQQARRLSGRLIGSMQAF